MARRLIRSSYWLLAIAAMVAYYFVGCGMRSPSFDRPDPCSEFNRTAATKLAAGDYDKAIEAYTQSINLNSQSAASYLGRGRAYMQKGFPDTAMADFNRAVRLAPDDPDAYFERARADLMLENSLRAVGDCTTSMRLRPAVPAVYELRGLAYLRLRSNANAVADLREAVRLDSSLAARLEPRIAEAQKLVENDAKPNAAKAVESGSESKAASQPPALAAMPQVVRKQVIPPDDSQADQLHADGVALLSQGDYAAAVGKQSEAIAIRPRFAAAYRARAEAHLMRGFPDTAVADLNDALVLDPSDIEAYCLRARARLMQKDYASAASDATEALRRKVDATDAYELRLKAYLGQSDCGRARVDFEELQRRDHARAEELRDCFAQAYYRQITSQIETARPEDAADSWLELRKLNPQLAGDLQEEVAQSILRRGRHQADGGFLLRARIELAALRKMQVRQAGELESYLKQVAESGPAEQTSDTGASRLIDRIRNR